MMKKLLLSGLVVMLAGVVQAQPQYTVVDLGTLGGEHSVANAINNKGEIAGQSTNKEGQMRAVKWVEGKLIDCGIDGVSSNALDINDNGYMVGYTGKTFGADSRAVYWTKENKPTAPDFTATWKEGGSALRAINEKNQIAGYAADKADGEVEGDAQGFLFRQETGQIEPLEGEGINFLPNGINESGQVVITLSYDGTQHAAIYPGKLPLEPEGNVQLIDINDKGQIALCLEEGEAYRLDTQGDHIGLIAFGAGLPIRINNAGVMVGLGEGGATLFKDRQAINLNTLIPADSGWMLAQASDINDNGQIVGVGVYKEKEFRAFLLQPIPGQ